MDGLLTDFRYSARRLLRSPGFTVVAVLTLVLGIGANTAIFSVVNAVLLQPLPYHDPEQIVAVWSRFPRMGIEQLGASEPEIFDFQKVQSFSHVGAYITLNLTLSGVEEPEVLKGAGVSAEMFPLLGVQPVVGRTFIAGEDRPGQMFTVLSHELWQRRFGSDPSVVGKAVMLNERSYTVLGVMPPAFQFPEETEVWIPLGIDPANLEARSEHFLNALARIRPGVSLEQAQTELRTLSENLKQEYPHYYAPDSEWTAYIVPLQEQIVGDLQKTLLVLFGAVAFVLLIACANVANLMLVRAQAQQKEVTVRAALGASWGHLVRQYFAESLLLSLLGAGLGLLVASWGVKILTATLARDLPRFKEIEIDGWVLLFTLIVAVLTAFTMSLLPALRSSRSEFSNSLKESGASAAAQPHRQRSRNLLVISEVAAALVLLIGSGLLLGALKELGRMDPGFQSEGLLTMRLSPSRVRYPQRHETVAFYQRLLESLESLPNVSQAALSSNLPFAGNAPSPSTFTIEGRPMHGAGGPPPSAHMRTVSSDYFRAMGIPLVAGRQFGTQDHSLAPAVVLVDESLARRYWPDENPLGKRIDMVEGSPDDTMRRYTVVGVVGSVKETQLHVEAEPHIYLHYPQNPLRSVYLVTRSQGNLDAAAGSIRRQVREVDQGVPLFEVQPMRERVSGSISQQNLSALLISIFAGLAVLLAAVGLYGVVSYSVVQRSREFGIRLALGAGRGTLLGMVIRQSAILVVLGLGIGLAAALGLTRLISSMLYGISSTEPSVFLSAALLLAFVGLAASYIPARRTTRVDPIIAIRYD